MSYIRNATHRNDSGWAHRTMRITQKKRSGMNNQILNATLMGTSSWQASENIVNSVQDMSFEFIRPLPSYTISGTFGIGTWNVTECDMEASSFWSTPTPDGGYVYLEVGN